MCFKEGFPKIDIVNDNEPNYSLKGMLCPTFQNQGVSPVYVFGQRLLQNESLPFNIPNVILTGEISIQFESQIKAERKLVVGYVRLLE